MKSDYDDIEDLPDSKLPPTVVTPDYEDEIPTVPYIELPEDFKEELRKAYRNSLN